MFKEFPDDDTKIDDFLNEFRQKISDHNIESIEEKKEELKRSRSIFIGITSGIGLAGIVGWLVLAPQYKVENQKEIPIIRRPQTAIRIQPNDPGGMDIPNQDKSIYNIIDKKDDNSVENLLPPPEEPKLPTIVAQETAEAESMIEVSEALPEAEKIIQQAETKNITTEEIIKKAETQTAQVTPQPTVKAVEKPETLEDIKVEVKNKIQEVENTVNNEKTKPADKPATPVKIAQTQQKKIEKPVGAVSGNWQIQLMSSPNKAAVEKAQNDLGKKYKISHLPFEIEAAVLDMNKTFFRLKVGAFKNRADADKLCNDIKNLGGTCIVKKK